VPMPLDNTEGEIPTVSSTDTQKETKTSTTTSTSKGNRGDRNSRGERGGTWNLTRSLDGVVPKRNGKNRTAAAANAYNPYQDYYSHYCMLEIFKFQIIISFFVDYNQEANGEKWYSDKQN